MMSTPDVHPAALEPDALLAECDVKRTRGSGPGGQHRNKVETAIVLTHRPTGVTAQASERRSQRDNHAAALFRLRVKLALHVRAEFAGAPSELWRGRCRGGRVSVSDTHADFPAMLAEALDATAAAGWDAGAAAELMGCSTSQLVKLFKAEPAALETVNRARAERGLHALR